MMYGMQSKAITRVLEEAARIEGSTQALASRLNAPEKTLLLWMNGRAQTPLRAFLATLDFVMQAERERALQSVAPPAADPVVRKLVLELGELRARCARCDATEFRSLEGAELKLTGRLACLQCGEKVVHGNLLAQLAKDAVLQSRARGVRSRRTAEEAHERVLRAQQRIDKSRRQLDTKE